MSAYTPAVYTGDGVTTNFAIPFTYLDPDDVKVAVAGVVAAHTFLSASLLQVLPAPAAGAVVKLARETDSAERSVIYTTAISLTGPQLNKSADQLFYMAQEAVAVANDAMARNAADVFDADGKRITNVANPVNAQDVATKSWVNTSGESAVASAAGSAAAAATNAGLTATDRGAVATDRAAVNTQKGLVDTAKTAVDTAKGLVDTAKAAVDTQAGLVATAKAAADADVVLTHADVVLTHADVVLTHADRTQTGADRIAAAQSASDAAGYAAGMQTVPVQIDLATDAAFADADMLTARKAADGTLLKRSWANTKAAVAGDPWALQPLGIPLPIFDHVTGLAPPTNQSYRYVKLTASDAYNTGFLTSESVSGSAPAVQATAVVNSVGSPLHGVTIRLMNTERRYLRAGSSGAVAADGVGTHTHTGSADSAGSHTHTGSADSAGAHQHGIPTYIAGGGTSGTIQPGSATSNGRGTINTDANGAHTHPLTIASGGAHTHPLTIAAAGASETSVKDIGATYYMRIK